MITIFLPQHNKTMRGRATSNVTKQQIKAYRQSTLEKMKDKNTKIYHRTIKQ